MRLNNPGAPATSRQLWLLHILTKQDTRNLQLTMQQASDAIAQAKQGGNGKSKTKANSRRHWQHSDFVITNQDSQGRYGYCGKCYGDMQVFNSDGLYRHYNSHKHAASLGLWGKR